MNILEMIHDSTAVASGNECGFYTAHHMKTALGLLNVQRLEDFEVMLNPLGEEVLDDIRENIASFLMTQVIDNKEEFHYKRSGYRGH